MKTPPFLLCAEQSNAFMLKILAILDYTECPRCSGVNLVLGNLDKVISREMSALFGRKVTQNLSILAQVKLRKKIAFPKSGKKYSN